MMSIRTDNVQIPTKIDRGGASVMHCPPGSWLTRHSLGVAANVRSTRYCVAFLWQAQEHNTRLLYLYAHYCGHKFSKTRKSRLRVCPMSVT